MKRRCYNVHMNNFGRSITCALFVRSIWDINHRHGSKPSCFLEAVRRQLKGMLFDEMFDRFVASIKYSTNCFLVQLLDSREIVFRKPNIRFDMRTLK